MYYRKLSIFLSLALLLIFLFPKEAVAGPVPQQLPLFKEYILHIEGQTLKTYLFINEYQRTMIPASELARIFSCTIDWADSNQIYIIKDDKYWGFTNNIPNCFTPAEIKTMATAPVIIAKDFYIPLRFIAEEMGYHIAFCPHHRTYYLSTDVNNILELECEKKEPDPLGLKITDKLPIWGSLTETDAFSFLYGDEKLISGYYTTLINSSSARTNNIKIAAQAIDNIVILPGQTFSFNQTVGERTTQKGYREAPTFVGKKVVSGVGGGICQITSTLYNAALLGNFSIVERHPHSLKVAYVAPNRDATVAWPTADFKFKNNYDFPVKLIVKVVDNYVVTALTDFRNTTPEATQSE